MPTTKLLLIVGLVLAGSFWVAETLSQGGDSFGWWHIMGCIGYVISVVAAIAVIRRQKLP